MWQTCRCVLYRNGGRFVWKRKAFCIKMGDVSIQNAFRFAIKRRNDGIVKIRLGPKRGAFWA